MRGHSAERNWNLLEDSEVGGGRTQGLLREVHPPQQVLEARIRVEAIEIGIDLEIDEPPSGGLTGIATQRGGRQVPIGPDHQESKSVDLRQTTLQSVCSMFAQARN